MASSRIKDFVSELVSEFSNSSKPFEEFADKIALHVLDSVETDRNPLAREIFARDWSTYSNQRGSETQTMSLVLAEGKRSEYEHIAFMKLLSEPFLMTDHDHSKDDFYVLMTSLRFRVKDFDVKNFDRFDKFFRDTVFKRHAELEPHHPEYEKFTGRECSLKDVTETAIDRMARNFQFSDGRGDFEAMMKFKPSWTFDNERKIAHYDNVVRDWYDKIKTAWNEFKSIE